MTDNLEGQENWFDQDIWFGKTSREPSVQTVEKTFESSLKRRQRSATKMPLYLCLEGGKWTTSGCIVGDGWSIAWRVLDAQFWGVPQRRRRIALVADFGGKSAPEILFVRQSVSRDIEQSEPKGKRTSSNAEGGIGGSDKNNVVSSAYTLKIRSGCEVGGKGALVQTDKSATLSTLQDQTVFQPVLYENHSQDSRYKELVGVSETVSAKYGTGGNNQPLVVSLDRASYNQGKNARYDIGISENGIAKSLVAKGPSAVCYTIGNGQADQTGLHEKAGTLNCMHDQQAVLVAAVDCRNFTENSDVNGTLQAKGTGGTSLNLNNCVRTRHIVRRLTPLECERLQGYPDGWTDIGEYIDSNGKKKQSSDAARYKAIGNSIAIPPWEWVMKRLCACYERYATMASLFDGIGGFPYIWEQLNGKGTCLWASEIEEFPIAVTRMRIGE